MGNFCRGWNGKKYFAAVWHDITEQKQYEKKLEETVKEETQKRLKQERLLIEQRKMAAMGEMLSGIAHNWRQPLSSAPIVVKSYQNTVKQILSNLLSNAKDAIVEKKKNGQEFEPKIKVTAEIAKTDIVRVCVFNNGGGISSETMDRLFEPYFTAKEQGKGVGLGLYMSRLAIEETIGGKITAANKEDGVEFCITIPL